MKDRHYHRQKITALLKLQEFRMFLFHVEILQGLREPIVDGDDRSLDGRESESMCNEREMSQVSLNIRIQDYLWSLHADRTSVAFDQILEFGKHLLRGKDHILPLLNLVGVAMNFIEINRDWLTGKLVFAENMVVFGQVRCFH